ncbi:STAS domain-containing protein [Cumulibacter manganitolerans]|uniref:STAS domain-containing protein n=1 Tax=Cumulibacter manganitolerans TaxID=1884992 RepID=UPI0012981737|nr:STAS domain-containing protein [Cumulibacter manganitolerans]
MSRIVAVVDEVDRAERIVAVARTYSRLLHASLVLLANPRVEQRLVSAEPAEDQEVRPFDGSVPSDLAAELVGLDPRLTVLPCGADATEGCLGLLGAYPGWLLAVPGGGVTAPAKDVRALSHPLRILAPIDGTAGAASVARAAVRMLGVAGEEAILLHVFERSTAPAFWDQSAHAQRAWETEFRARLWKPAATRLELRLDDPDRGARRARRAGGASAGPSALVARAAAAASWVRSSRPATRMRRTPRPVFARRTQEQQHVRAQSSTADACVISIDHCPERRIVLISMWGTVGSDALDRLSEAVEEAIGLHPRWVLIDLGTARLDPDGLALLHLTRRKLARHHVRLAVTGISRRVRGALERIGESPRCPFYTTVDVAIAAIDALESPSSLVGLA